MAVGLGFLFLVAVAALVVFQLAVVAGNRRRALGGSVPAGQVPTDTGSTMRCHHCGGDRFDRREAQLNTSGMTFFGLDWANRSASCFVCQRCGYIHWFLLQ